MRLPRETDLTEESAEISLPPVDKAAIDASEGGSWLICAERAQIVSAENFSNTADRILGRMEEHGTFLDLSPLRLVLLTPELHNRAKDWQRHLGRPEAGVSQQEEVVAASATLPLSEFAGCSSESGQGRRTRYWAAHRRSHRLAQAWETPTLAAAETERLRPTFSHDREHSGLEAPARTAHAKSR